MAEGRRRHSRQMVVAQAALVWFSGTDEDITEFLSTGELNGSDGKEDVIPYDPELVKSIVGTGKVV